MQTQVITLPQTGYVRQSLLVGDAKTGIPGILPFSASTLWRRVRAQTFPAPLKLSERVTAWKAEDIRQWLDAQGRQAA
ncbi:AlpA family transcriptional regulator [Vogesella sp. AC12]|uniref:helix-turn-helix transcriptional regulator n=1 Tax=Vogesella sp. AC12 TaxID=2950550 RepID=UPI00210ADDA1|nr:AlpA family phage regulatory protein [Vogesella sp. AC12]MCQ4145642.1 AlpA family phage regulatory protein [Vogesella sp. AC12]